MSCRQKKPKTLRKRKDGEIIAESPDNKMAGWCVKYIGE
jgi:hypothetical protein